MKYLVSVEVMITEPQSVIKTLKFEVTADNENEAIDKVAKLYRTEGLMSKEYEYTPVAVEASNLKKDENVLNQ